MTMVVDQSTYRAYTGERRPGRRAALAIASTHIRKMRRQRLVRAFVYFVPLIVGAIAAFMFTMVYMNPEMFRIIRRLGDDANLLAVANRAFQESIWFVALLMAALVGSPLIAEDRRAKALPLYFSRPLTHFDYVMGKLFTLWFFLGALLIVPPVLFYLLEVSLNPDDGIIAGQFPTFLKSLIPSVARIVPLSAVALGVSSLMRRSQHATLLFFGLFIPLQGISFILKQVFDDSAWLALSPENCVRAVNSSPMRG